MIKSSIFLRVLKLGGLRLMSRLEKYDYKKLTADGFVQISEDVAGDMLQTIDFPRERMATQVRLGFSWLLSGFPTIEVGNKLAASFASTSLTEEAVERVARPWKCFLVRVPAGILGAADCFKLLLENEPGGNWGFRTLTYVGDVGAGSVIELFKFSQLLDEPMPNSSHPFSEQDLSKIERSHLLINRIVIGALIEMDSPERKRAIKGGPRYPDGRNKRGEPASWNFKLTRPVKVDVREAVRDYVDGTRHGKLSLQHLVRGHHKMQRCGQGGSERRWIHVEPYWRGPEDAPIALRSHILGDRGDASIH